MNVLTRPPVVLVADTPLMKSAALTYEALMWRMRLEASLNTPRAVGAIFNWCATAASRELEPRVLVAQFGDGYAQRRPAGINTQDEIWSLTFSNRSAAVAAAIDDFLKARNGVDVFVWTPPRQSTALNVICPEWSIAYGDLANDGARVMNINAKFQQVHQ